VPRKDASASAREPEVECIEEIETQQSHLENSRRSQLEMAIYWLSASSFYCFFVAKRQEERRSEDDRPLFDAATD
jgi:hypothetical protein